MVFNVSFTILRYVPFNFSISSGSAKYFQASCKVCDYLTFKPKTTTSGVTFLIAVLISGPFLTLDK